MKIIKRVHKPKQRVICMAEYMRRTGLWPEVIAREDERIATLNKLVKEAESRSGKKGE